MTARTGFFAMPGNGVAVCRPVAASRRGRMVSPAGGAAAPRVKLAARGRGEMKWRPGEMRWLHGEMKWRPGERK